MKEIETELYIYGKRATYETIKDIVEQLEAYRKLGTPEELAELKAETERLKIALQNACNTIKSANAYIFDEPYPSDINYYLGGNADD